ncbi:2OG-Fe(II) oxygenase [Pseudomonas sp. GD04087]|uniref:2OG-Fe(II) oxygenase n=1 Tax=unclassified Pseudomonas TaxID=196821 RepID=UPI00244AE1D6|nr:MULTISPECIES: 2OG-Fe(II) oxygenase [unclassified Pseudomonas]MDH0292986.1 2OG-Fe(II) oxygenase [Pseudomonas sp. GD04087]MDH1052158.1 2OG-Fe(II) oxygenase [Pseudomonas sp. GD03903]MDH2003309.1 2OG-Fe(II) oxygenase [Pseudomonas sp. GD03691]
MPNRSSLTEQLASLDWSTLTAQLDADGHALIPGLLDRAQCEMLRALYEQDAPFRSRVVMARHNFGLGEYRYFAYPLPALLQSLREAFYPPLRAIANSWHERMGTGIHYPPEHADYLAQCHAAGQRRPTPLLLRYRAADYNCLHQDLYGELAFPLQVAILLSRPGEEFEGGELVLTEQRPRMQSRASVVPLQQGDAVLFAVAQRPVRGARGYHRVSLRHGVSRLHTGERFTLGLIFHDAL